MHKNEIELTAPAHWKKYLWIIFKVMLGFILLTFILGYAIYHRPVNWLIPITMGSVVYLIAIILGIRHLIKTLPLAVLMLLIPIAPLFVLIYLITLMGFLQGYT